MNWVTVAQGSVPVFLTAVIAAIGGFIRMMVNFEKRLTILETSGVSDSAVLKDVLTKVDDLVQSQARELGHREGVEDAKKTK